MTAMSTPWGGRPGREGHPWGPRKLKMMGRWMAMGGHPGGPHRGRGESGGPFGGFEPPYRPGPPQVPPHGPFSGNPFGGNPFEAMFGGGRGRRRGPRARRGDVRTGILLLLAEEPRSGYEIIREGKERSHGAWRPSPGSVYPMLQQMEDEGLVRPAESTGGRRRPYELTEEGHAYVEEHAAELTPPWEAVAEEYEDAHARYAEIRNLTAQVMAAAGQVMQAGTDEQLDRAKQVLSETKRALYRILAEDDSGTSDDDGESEEMDDTE